MLGLLDSSTAQKGWSDVDTVRTNEQVKTPPPTGLRVRRVLWVAGCELSSPAEAERLSTGEVIWIFCVVLKWAPVLTTSTNKNDSASEPSHFVWSFACQIPNPYSSASSSAAYHWDG